MRPAPWPFGCAPLGAVLPAGGPSRTRAFETPVTLAMGTTVPTSSLELFTIVRAEAAERGATSRLSVTARWSNNPTRWTGSTSSHPGW